LIGWVFRLFGGVWRYVVEEEKVREVGIEVEVEGRWRRRLKRKCEVEVELQGGDGGQKGNGGVDGSMIPQSSTKTLEMTCYSGTKPGTIILTQAGAFSALRN
jgi:hypothetical protein